MVGQSGVYMAKSLILNLTYSQSGIITTSKEISYRTVKLTTYKNWFFFKEGVCFQFWLRYPVAERFWLLAASGPVQYIDADSWQVHVNTWLMSKMSMSISVPCRIMLDMCPVKNIQTQEWFQIAHFLKYFWFTGLIHKTHDHILLV